MWELTATCVGKSSRCTGARLTSLSGLISSLVQTQCGGWKWSYGSHYLIIADCGCPKGGSFLSKSSHNSPDIRITSLPIVFTRWKTVWFVHQNSLEGSSSLSNKEKTNTVSFPLLIKLHLITFPHSLLMTRVHIIMRLHHTHTMGVLRRPHILRDIIAAKQYDRIRQHNTWSPWERYMLLSQDITTTQSYLNVTLYFPRRHGHRLINSYYIICMTCVIIKFNSCNKLKSKCQIKCHIILWFHTKYIFQKLINIRYGYGK